MKNNLSGIFEVIWFVLGGFMLFIAVDVSMDGGFRESWFYFLFSVIAFVMYYFRRRMRISRR
jgi:ABC-type transport system involved in cytochrome c biogenesis permease subunit